MVIILISYGKDLENYLISEVYGKDGFSWEETTIRIIVSNVYR